MTRFTQGFIAKSGTLALCLAIAVSPVYGTGMCSIDGSSLTTNFSSAGLAGDASFISNFSSAGLTDDYNFLFDPIEPGGISLDRTLTLLNDVANIRGAAYDPAKGEVVFIGEGTVPIAEKIDIDDLVIALRSIYAKKPLIY